MKVASPFKTHFGAAAAAIPSPLPFSHYTLPYTNPFGYSTFSLLLLFQTHHSTETDNSLFGLVNLS